MRYILLALLISCSACASKVQWATVEPKATLAVAHSFIRKITGS
jgi:hypothetical protein